MLMKIYRKENADVALGFDDLSLYIRRGKAKAALKKAVVMPKSVMGDLSKALSEKIEEFIADGYVYVSTFDTDDKNPYPRFNNDVAFHWAFKKSEQEISIEDLLDQIYTALSYFDPEFISMDSVERDLDTITFKLGKTDFSIGHTSKANIYIPLLRPFGDTLSVTDGPVPFLILLYLSRCYPDNFSITNSESDLISYDLNLSSDLLPFEVDESILKIGEKLGICIVPTNWSNVANNDNSQSSVWMF